MFNRLKKSLLVCPTCGYKQQESPSARSTFCRNRECGIHYEIENGIAVAAPPTPDYPFPLGRQNGGTGDPPATRTPGPPQRLLSRQSTQLEFFATLQAQAPRETRDETPANRPRVTTPSGDHPAIARMARLLPEVPKEGHRHIHCLECDFPQSIPIKSLSTMCLRCTAPIPLREYHIREMHHRRIRTRGNVHVHRRGGIRGVSVECNDLIIEGSFTGRLIDCDGDLVIDHDCNLEATVRCRRLIIRGGAEVSFSKPVEALVAIIDGTVKGNLVCERDVHLEKKALLEGDIQARSLSIGEDAHHAGRVSMPPRQQRYAKFTDPAALANLMDGPEDHASEAHNPFVAVGTIPPDQRAKVASRERPSS